MKRGSPIKMKYIITKKRIGPGPGSLGPPPGSVPDSNIKEQLLNCYHQPKTLTRYDVTY